MKKNNSIIKILCHNFHIICYYIKNLCFVFCNAIKAANVVEGKDLPNIRTAVFLNSPRSSLPEYATLLKQILQYRERFQFGKTR